MTQQIKIALSQIKSIDQAKIAILSQNSFYKHVLSHPIVNGFIRLRNLFANKYRIKDLIWAGVYLHRS